jgi:pSer/pThr/pTyr-binding forkhead associated (FHA) protein
MSTTWERKRRDLIASYIGAGAVIAEDDVLHECVLCGVSAGYRERTDGVWRWPEGLAHYVVDHGVKIPPEFLDMMARHEFVPPKVDIKSLREQMAPTDARATGLLSKATAAAALDEILAPRVKANQTHDGLDDATEAIPVGRPWATKVMGVPTKQNPIVLDRPIVLGRDRTCDVVLEHRSVSRRHVRLVPWRDRVIVQDLGSSNGVYIRGQRKDGQVEAREGDQLSIGQATITLVRDASER